MANDFGLGLDLGLGGGNNINAAAVGSTVMDTLVIIASLVLVLGVMYAFYFFLRYNIRFRLKVITGTKKINIDTRAREVKAKDGSIHYKLLYKFMTIPEPPPDCIEINARGRPVVQAYMTPEKEIVYIEDKNIYGVPEMTINKKDNDASVRVVHSLYPVTRNDRKFYTSEMQKAADRRSSDWKQNIPQIAGFGFIIVIFALTLIYWEDIIAPAGQVADKNVKIVEQQEQILDNLNSIMRGEQRIVPEKNSGGGRADSGG